ncbi:MAG: hypothetical protein JWO13_2242 [Acidobacteriales bacterium]|nr:hypothetical protein [Terriglobales bacterium]
MRTKVTPQILYDARAADHLVNCCRMGCLTCEAILRAEFPAKDQDLESTISRSHPRPRQENV